MSKKSTYIIAEAGVNHNGDYEVAKEMIVHAAKAGANGVKFQTFNSAALVNKDLKKANYQIANTKTEDSQYEMLRKLELPLEWHKKLQALAKKYRIDFLSTAFDTDSLRFLRSLNLPAYKIGSGDLTNGPLLWEFGQLRRPLILSTGMSTLSEVEEALVILNYSLNKNKEPLNLSEAWEFWSQNKIKKKLTKLVTLLHCTTQYPTNYKEVNLLAMETLKNAFNLKVGYSDHTLDTVVSIGAIARGATIIEKHFTLDKNMNGPDHKASLEPKEFSKMVLDIRNLEKSLGSPIKSPQPSEIENIGIVRQKLIAAKKIKKGKTISRSDLTTSRAERGLKANKLWEVIGKKSPKIFLKGQPIEF